MATTQTAKKRREKSPAKAPTKGDLASVEVARWAIDPVAFVSEAFNATPDAWQAEALRAVVDNPRVAMSACKGPGKSCVLAWMVWWFLMTRYDAEIVVMSITEDNLRDNLWKELAIWLGRSEMLRKAFRFGGERIVCTCREKTWWASARAFSQTADKSQQANTIAGFHGKHVMVVLDEVGDFPEGVVVAAEGIFANEDIEARLVVAGNPTNTQGPLFRITNKDSKRWNLIRITGDPEDPNRSPRISLTWAKEQIEDWGRDNPWVRVNVLGLFPTASTDQLIGVDVILAAQDRDAKPPTFSKSARVWGLDPARFGDDEAVLFKRQGIVARRPRVWRNKSGVDLANAVAHEILEAEKTGELPDTLFCDVGGQGASCYDHLTVLGWGHVVVPVDFGGSPDDERFLNKRAEMWWRMADWLSRQPSCIPTDNVLAGELPGPKFFYRVSGKRTKFVLESKDDMKRRGVPSPNRADALALTFAGPVAPRARSVESEAMGHSKTATEYSPHDRAETNDRVRFEYDPYRS